MKVEALQRFLARHVADAARVELRLRTLSGASVRLDLWKAPLPDVGELASTMLERAQADLENQRGKIVYLCEPFDSSGASLGRLPMPFEGEGQIEPAEANVANDGQIVGQQQAFIRALLDTLLNSHSRMMTDARELVQVVLGSYKALSADMSELQRTLRMQGVKRDDAELLRLQADIERMRVQAQLKSEETKQMIEADTHERTMNALEAFGTAWAAKSAPAPALQKFAATLTGDQMGAIMGTLTPEQQIMFNGIHAALSPTDAPSNGSL